MCDRMRTAVFTDVRKIEIQECKRPIARENQVLVKVDACAICTWEQRVYTGVKKVEFPFIGGHEIAGHIVSIGDKVNQREWNIGDKVLVGVAQSCRNCVYCKSGREHCCEHFNHSAHLDGMPHKGMGGLSEYMLVSTDCIFKYYNVTPEEAAITEPLSCVIHSINVADVQLGDTVLVIGCGIMGLLHTILATKKGANVIVSDTNEERLERAKELGAKYIINPTKEDLSETVMEITRGLKVQVVFETIPNVNILDDCFKCVSNEGKVVLYSSFHPDVPTLFNPNWVHGKSIKILGTANSNDKDFIKASKMVSEGIIDLKPFVSEVYDFDNIKDAFESSAKADKFRVVVRF